MTKVKINSTVTWVDIKTGEADTYTIVPRSVEYSPVWTGERGRGKKFAYAEKIKLGEEGTIDPEAPLAKYSIGKTLGDIVTVNVDGNISRYKIVSIDGETQAISDNAAPAAAYSATHDAPKPFNEKESERKKTPDYNRRSNGVKFSLADRLKNFEYSESGVSLSIIVKKINTLIEKDFKVDYKIISDWLIKQNAIKVVKIDGIYVKMPTPLGVRIGIYAEAREDYVATLYNKEAQKYIIDHIADISADK